MQRTLALGALWTASAGAAVGLGFLAVSLVDASASPGTGPAAASTILSGTSGTSTTPMPTPTSATGQFATVAGTVYANCTGGVPVLAGAPAAGWWVDDSSDPSQVEFKSDTQKLEVHVVCAGGGPQFSVEGPRADDSGGHGGDDGSPSPASSSSAEHTPDDRGGDDSSGRDGGGHGSDDSGSGDSGSGSDNSGSGNSGGDDD